MMTSKQYISRCKFVNSFKSVLLNNESLLIVDEKLKRLIPTFFLKNKKIYWVKAGEDLKNLKHLPKHLYNISLLLKNFSRTQVTIVAIGGGSVGDFAGFVASVYMRGVRLIHIPSTWLGAVDSAHGGKTALNLNGKKNQVGTFYLAERIYLVKSLLQTQPTSRAKEAFFEYFKMALLTKKSWGKRFVLASDPSLLWEYLPHAVREKYEIVAKDPLDILNKREVLNLGHTLGHALEARFKIPHGIAIGYGLDFSLWWSAKRKYLPKDRYIYLHNCIFSLLTPKSFKPFPLKSFLRADKKRTSNSKLRFVFVKSFGIPITREVDFADLERNLTLYCS